MSENSLKVGKSCAEEFVFVKNLVEKFRKDGEDDLVDKFLYDEGALTDSETGEEHYLDRGYGIEIRTEIILTLAGGGPALRALVIVDSDGDVVDCKLQHQDWFAPWVDVELNGEEEDALEWYLLEALDLPEHRPRYNY